MSEAEMKYTILKLIDRLSACLMKIARVWCSVTINSVLVSEQSAKPSGGESIMICGQ